MKKANSGNPTKKEHYIPRFLIKQFANEQGCVIVIDKKETHIKPRLTHFKAVLFENDLYETKNYDGTYFERNAIEQKFKQIEDKMSAVVNSLCNGIDSQTILSESNKEILSEFVALQLVRLPFVKQIIKETKYKVISENEKNFYNDAMYRMILESRNSGFDFLEENGLGLSQESKEQLKGGNLIEYTMNFILKECSIYFAVAAETGSFILSDNPILIDAFPDVHYLMPITPYIAICCGWKTGDGEGEENIIYISDIGIYKINSFSYRNAIRWIVCQESCCDMAMNLLSEQEKK